MIHGLEKFVIHLTTQCAAVRTSLLVIKDPPHICPPPKPVRSPDFALIET